MLDLLKKAPAAEALSTIAALGDAPPAVAGVAIELDLGRILDNPYQPRTVYDPVHILDLALSIKRHKAELAATRGLQQLPLARVGTVGNHGEFIPAAAAMYANGGAAQLLTKRRTVVQLLFGHSRLRAFMLLDYGLARLRDGAALGLNLAGVAELQTRYAELLEPDPDYATMPIMLAFALDRQMWAHAITENSQRRDITAIEEARSLQRAIDEFGLTTDEAAAPFGYARSTVANKLRLLALPTDVQGMIERGELTERHGRELVRLAADPDLVRSTAADAVTKGSTVRQLVDAINWKEKQLRYDLEMRRQLAAVRQALAAAPWALPGQDVAIGADRVSDAPHYQLVEFRADDKSHQALIANGWCGPACACFAIGYSPSYAEYGHRPAPDVAPHCCACCTNRAAYWEKRRQVDDDPTGAERAQQEREKKERERQARQLNDEAHRLWQRWLAGVERPSLWGDLRFWREVGRWPSSLYDVFKSADDLPAAFDALLQLIYRQTREYDRDLRADVHQPDEVVALIARLGGSVSRETGGGK